MPRGVRAIQFPLYISSSISSAPRIIPLQFFFSSSHVCAHPPPGWNKVSLSTDASEEHDGYSSGEEPMNSDPEDEVGKKLVSLNLEGSRITIHGGVFSCSPTDCVGRP